jgi:twitching motility protein PilJ
MIKLTTPSIINFLKILLTLLVLLTILIVWVVRKQDFYDHKYREYTSELRVLTQRIAKRVGEISAIGSEPSYEELYIRRDQFDKIIKILVNGEYDELGTQIIPPSPPYIQQGNLGILVSNWQETKKLLDYILSNKTLIISSQQLNLNLQARLHKITDLYWQILSKYDKTELKVENLLKITYQIGDLATLADHFEKILTLTIPTPDLEKTLPKKLEEFTKRAGEIDALNTNTEIALILNQIDMEILTIHHSIESTIKTGQTLDKVYIASQKILKDNLRFLEDATNLYEDYAQLTNRRTLTHTTINIVGVTALLVLILLGYLLNRQAKLELLATEEKNRKINSDIDTLINELSDLANGNLAIKVTVNAGITKEIANAINYTIEALRKLVMHINESTQQASNLTVETQKLTSDLAYASEKQTKEIIKATTAVGSMEKLAEKVSSHASEIAAVAQQSVTIANEGGEEVRKTIDGIIRIQTQIRIISAKMTKLGESSNEIGQIISMIDGIANQTNILSLNASIQAAMAGEAGLGFGVVADEVQQLAEKVRLATQDIETLVKSMQLETREVIACMEETRVEVKEDGVLAFNAGKALEKIEFVSNNLANHIQSISLSAEEQKNMSNTISNMMKIVEEISQGIESGSINTAEFTTKLTTLVSKLRSAVSEFKLPTDNSANI